MGVKFSKSEINEVIRRVITYYLRKKELHIERGKELILIPRYPVGLQRMLSEFELYGELDSVDFLSEGTDTYVSNITGCRMYYTSDEGDVSYVLNGLSAYEKLEIYDPSLDLLRALKDGRENDIFVKITIHFLMSGRPVIARMPYDINRSSEGAFGKGIRDLREELWDMGLVFSDLNLDPSDGVRIEKKLDFVAEEDIENYYKNGESVVYADKTAVITPLAMEKAKELNVSIIRL